MKQYSPREAAIAVLKKAEEMLKSLPADQLAKFEMEEKPHPKKEHEDKQDGQDQTVETSQTPEETTAKNPEGSNPAPGAEPQAPAYDAGFKGHIKLAKFMGHMESKKKAPKAESHGQE